ncbi:hypothetical protein [Burkholderia vietnamiensis]|uniref:hypothetical protein n=1 Tax=Burkholderia vietnamiensis TaxID=60552 RepID=UPI00075B27A8|nr:hypothetical protein [Burkholderia vietnamiensis]KVE55087.1 hypothetical protein WI94_14280 [Burkholderia vietnamiensis]KVE85000.1 hypothetical protein WJ00_18075 [Burkholderia vietnamiensis]MDN7924998.1 hypothetical protein [Burkholderia vietnamiensis]HDR9249071.1 hypothetical protein [Burkholderia vietnamiensis]
MHHPLRFSSAATIACALSLCAADASSRDSLIDGPGNTNLFHSERRAAARNDVRPVRPKRRAKEAAPLKRSPFDTRDTRALRVSGDKLEPQPSAGGSPGRVLSEIEQREQRRNEHRWADERRPVDVPNHSIGAPNPFLYVPDTFNSGVLPPPPRMFYDNGARSRCAVTGGAGTSRSVCSIGR